jgi:hypothetical protein
VFYERIVEKSIIGHYYRHSELAERTESVIINLILFNNNLNTSLYDVPRSVNNKDVAMPAFPFVRSMGPKTRNV